MMCFVLGMILVGREILITYSFVTLLELCMLASIMVNLLSFSYKEWFLGGETLKWCSTLLFKLACELFGGFKMITSISPPAGAWPFVLPNWMYQSIILVQSPTQQLDGSSLKIAAVIP